MKNRIYSGNVERTFRSLVATLSFILGSHNILRTTRQRRRTWLFFPLLILFGFLVLPVHAQRCTQSIIFSDNFESDPSSRWTIGRESTDPSTFVPRDWTWVHTLPDDVPGSAFFAPDPAAPELCSAPAPGQSGVLLLESPPITASYIEGLRLSFNQWVSLETGFDGGQLMISVGARCTQSSARSKGAAIKVESEIVEQMKFLRSHLIRSWHYEKLNFLLERNGFRETFAHFSANFRYKDRPLGLSCRDIGKTPGPV